MKLIFAGTPEFAQVAMSHLQRAGHDVVLVLTQPDRPAGRGMKLQASPVKQLAQDSQVSVIQPRGLRLDGRYADDAQAAFEAIAAAQADVMIVAAYGLILPAWVLTAPRWGCLNIHASLLPRWRGAAPIHRAIEAGDAQTGISIMQMDEGLDTGAVLRMQAIDIAPDDTTQTLHDRLAELGGQLLQSVLHDLAAGTLNAPTPQPNEGVTYAHKIEKAEAHINWRTCSAQLLARRVRAFTPFPNCAIALGADVVKVWGVALDEADVQGAVAGQIVAATKLGVDVQTQAGLFRITHLQRPNAKRVTAFEFLQHKAYAALLEVGCVLV